jgi:hypothetical protein
MNVRHLVLSVSRRLLSIGFLILAAGLQQPVHASDVDLTKFRRIEPQYIAALGDPGATFGNGAQSWGLWSQDPGPRGAGPLRSIEGDWRRGAFTLEIRRCGLVAGGARLDHGEADLSAASREIPRHGRSRSDDRADNSAPGTRTAISDGNSPTARPL